MASKKKAPIKERWKDLIEEYGKIAFILHFSIAALTYVGLFIAIKSGIQIDDTAAGSTATYFAAWVALKVTMPVRLGVTVVLTPIVAKVWHHFRPPSKLSTEASKEDPKGKK